MSCECGHTDAWHRYGTGSCIECGCSEYVDVPGPGAADEVLRRIEWLAVKGGLSAEEAVEQIASLAAGYRLAKSEEPMDV